MLWNIGVKPRGGLLQSFTPQITYQPGGGATSYRKVADRVQETTSTTGTGTYTLAGAKDGFQSFAAVGDAAVTYYCCTDGTDYEIGLGTYTASGTTLARTTIIESSNSDAAVNWGSGDKDIFVTLPASRAVVQGVNLYQDNLSTGIIPSNVPTAAASYSIAMGYQALVNTNGAYSLALGYDSYTNGSRAVAIGDSYSAGTASVAIGIASGSTSYGATGNYSLAMGQLAKSVGANSVAIGQFNTTNATFSSAIGGAGNVTQNTASYSFVSGQSAKSTIVGQKVHAAGAFAASGDAQGSVFILRADTTDATATVLTTNNASGSTNNQIVAASDTCISFDGTITAMQNGAQAYASWRIEGLLVNDGGTTTLANSATTVISNSSSWGMALSADNTNNALAITCTGEAAHNIRWVANIRTSEVTYA